MLRTVYILSAVRTPIGKFGGALVEFTHPDLGTTAVRAALERAFGLPLPPERAPGEFAYAPGGRESRANLRWRVDEVIFGNARPAGVGPNPARQIAWRAGLGDDVPASTVNMACASGLRAVVLGWQEIMTAHARSFTATRYQLWLATFRAGTCLRPVAGPSGARLCMMSLTETEPKWGPWDRGEFGTDLEMSGCRVGKPQISSWWGPLLSWLLR